MESISIAGDLLFPSDEEIVSLVERYDLVIEEICGANANPPACRVYFKQDGPITDYVSLFEWEWEREESIAPHIAVFSSSETEGEAVERIKAAVENRGARVVKIDFPEMGIGSWTKWNNHGVDAVHSPPCAGVCQIRNNLAWTGITTLPPDGDRLSNTESKSVCPAGRFNGRRQALTYEDSSSAGRMKSNITTCNMA